MQKINKLSKIQVKKPPAVVLERFHGAFGRIISERYSTCGSGNAAAASIVDSAVWEHLVFVLLRGRTKKCAANAGNVWVCACAHVCACVSVFVCLCISLLGLGAFVCLCV